MIPDTRLYHLTRARARLFSADDAGRIGWVRAMELRDAAESLRMAGEPDMAVLADDAATSISADAGVPALLDQVGAMLQKERIDGMSTDQWFREFEREEANRQQRLDDIRGDIQRRDLFADLRRLTKQWTIHDDIPVSEQRECREIGKKLHALGREELMLQAYYDATGENRAAHVVAAYWDGIGEWRW